MGVSAVDEIGDGMFITGVVHGVVFDVGREDGLIGKSERQACRAEDQLIIVERRIKLAGRDVFSQSDLVFADVKVGKYNGGDITVD